MHIPDGMLDTKTWVSTWVGSAGIVGYASRKLRGSAEDGRVVLMAVMAALVFALQMLNFPVGAGTSGHFTGGAMAGIVLGPWAGVTVMAAVVAVQALLFADGGVTALGANLLDMAVVAPLAGWWLYTVLARQGKARRTLAAAAASWSATVLSALSAALLLWLSGRAPLVPLVAAMGGWHALVGVGEAVITAGLVSYLANARPDLLEGHGEERPLGGVGVTLASLALAAAGASFLASTAPDAMERVYSGLGRPFDGTPLLTGPIPDYLLPGVPNEALAGVLAAIVGLAVTGAAVYAVAGGARGGRRR